MGKCDAEFVPYLPQYPTQMGCSHFQFVTFSRPYVQRPSDLKVPEPGASTCELPHSLSSESPQRNTQNILRTPYCTRSVWMKSSHPIVLRMMTMGLCLSPKQGSKQLDRLHVRDRHRSRAHEPMST